MESRENQIKDKIKEITNSLEGFTSAEITTILYAAIDEAAKLCVMPKNQA